MTNKPYKINCITSNNQANNFYWGGQNDHCIVEIQCFFFFLNDHLLFISLDNYHHVRVHAVTNSLVKKWIVIMYPLAKIVTKITECMLF